MKSNPIDQKALSLIERDRKAVWHPLVQHKNHPEMLPIVKAKGSLLYDENGKTYIDAISSWYTAMYGHCNKKLIQALTKQANTLDQIIFSGFTHQPSIKLAEKLLELLPDPFTKVFYNDNGSTATEIGIKMALQYHHNQGHQKDTLIALEEGFHGDTFGAMSVSGLSVYNGAFENHFLKVERLARPNGKNNAEVIQQLKRIISHHKIAGFIYEPLVQGAAGMKTYDKSGLNDLLKLCKDENIICIADEVMTGFGKTSTCFASQQIETLPDIICLSKALTAGIVPMGATVCQEHIYQAFYDSDNAKGLFHAHTYSGNPLACAVALEAIHIYESKIIQQKIKAIHQSHLGFIKSHKDHPKVKDIRCIGVILAMDLDLDIDRYGSTRDKLFNFFMERGIYLRPLGNTVYTVPPYTISQQDLDKIHKAFCEVMEFA